MKMKIVVLLISTLLSGVAIAAYSTSSFNFKVGEGLSYCENGDTYRLRRSKLQISYFEKAVGSSELEICKTK